MKKLVFLLILSVFITACKWSGSDHSVKVSTFNNENCYLMSKKTTDFDRKYGYEVLCYTNDTIDKLKIKDIKVFIPKQIFERIPDPNDTMNVVIYYIKNIEYGDNSGEFSFFSIWDFQFNLCIGYHTVKK